MNTPVHMAQLRHGILSLAVKPSLGTHRQLHPPFFSLEMPHWIFPFSSEAKQPRGVQRKRQQSFSLPNFTLQGNQCY